MLAGCYARALDGESSGEVFNAAVSELGDWAAGYGLDQGMRADKARAQLGWSPTRLDWESCLKMAV